jgi:hypothetical protein
MNSNEYIPCLCGANVHVDEISSHYDEHRKRGEITDLKEDLKEQFLCYICNELVSLSQVAEHTNIHEREIQSERDMKENKNSYLDEKNNDNNLLDNLYNIMNDINNINTHLGKFINSQQELVEEMKRNELSPMIDFTFSEEGNIIPITQKCEKFMTDYNFDQYNKELEEKNKKKINEDEHIKLDKQTFINELKSCELYDCYFCKEVANYKFSHDSACPSYHFCKVCINIYIKNRYTCGGDKEHVCCCLCRKNIAISFTP